MKSSLGWAILGALVGASAMFLVSGKPPVPAEPSLPSASVVSDVFLPELSPPLDDVVVPVDLSAEQLARQAPSAPPHALPPLPMEGWSPDKQVSAALADMPLPPAVSVPESKPLPQPSRRQASLLEKHARALPGVSSVAWGGVQSLCAGKRRFAKTYGRCYLSSGQR